MSLSEIDFTPQTHVKVASHLRLADFLAIDSSAIHPMLCEA